MIRLKYTIALILMLGGFMAKAQDNHIRGQVIETGTNNKLSDVLVQNTNNNQVILTAQNGSFDIRGLLGHTLIFSSPGYVSDTLYITDLKYKSITMTPLGIALREVNVRGQRFNPRTEYRQVYEKSKVYVLSPTSWFGKDAKDARRLKRYFEREVNERHVDSVFTKAYVGSIVPLKDRELENFMILYRPSYEFIRSNKAESLAAYINDSYKKYMALPPDQRTLPKLTTQ
jgi:hypothetical protein